MVQITPLSSVLQAAAAQTTNFTSPVGTIISPSADLKQIVRGVIAYVVVTAFSGTTPSMTVKLQDSADGVNFADSGATSAAITSNGIYRIPLSGLGPYVQAVSTITGTTPSFTYSVLIAGTL